jgi:hypothetical protein
MSKTYQDRYVEALIARGWRINSVARSSKYIELVQGVGAQDVMGHPVADPTTKMFVGKSGAVRYGKTVSDSFSMLETTKRRLLTTVVEKVP